MQRTLKLLREEGYTCEITEHFNPYSKTRKDMWGFADIAALHAAHIGTLYVQTTTGDHMAERRDKILALPSARLTLEAQNRIWLIGWRQVGPRGKRKTWEPRVEALTLADFAAELIP